jgi:hypothetical protein
VSSGSAEETKKMNNFLAVRKNCSNQFFKNEFCRECKRWRANSILKTSIHNVAIKMISPFSLILGSKPYNISTHVNFFFMCKCKLRFWVCVPTLLTVNYMCIHLCKTSLLHWYNFFV